MGWLDFATRLGVGLGYLGVALWLYAKRGQYLHPAANYMVSRLLGVAALVWGVFYLSLALIDPCVTSSLTLLTRVLHLPIIAALALRAFFLGRYR